MIDLYYWPTPNGHKISIFLEEAQLPYRFVPVNIGAGDQFEPEFLRISPNNRMPAIVDHEPDDGGEPQSVFESGAILMYLSGKTGRFLPADPRQKIAAMEWLFWQMGGLGPMLGQNHHFANYAPEKIPYAIERYQKETTRLYRVLDRRLEGREFIADSYSIADMACYPWILPDNQGQTIDDFPALKAWHARIKARPAVQRAYEKGKMRKREHEYDRRSQKSALRPDRYASARGVTAEPTRDRINAFAAMTTGNAVAAEAGIQTRPLSIVVMPAKAGIQTRPPSFNRHTCEGRYTNNRTLPLSSYLRRQVSKQAPLPLAVMPAKAGIKTGNL